MREFNHSGRRVHTNLVVFTQSTRIVQPGKSPLRYPTLPRFYIRRNINATVEQGISVINKSTAVTFVGAISLYRRIRTRGNHYERLHPKDNPRYLLLFVFLFLLFFSPVETALVVSVGCLDALRINNGIGWILLLTGIFSRHFYQVFKD